MKKLALCTLLTSYIFASETDVQLPNQETIQRSQKFVENEIAQPYFTADFIYWKAREDGFQYVVTGVGTESQPVQETGTFRGLDFEGHPGYRIGVGLNIGHDRWDIYLQYTWLYADADDRYRGESGSEIFMNRFLERVKRAHAGWDLQINSIDWEWGRRFYISPFFQMRPSLGLKGFWSDQDFYLRSSGLINVMDSRNGRHNMDLSEDAWGLGIRFGVQTVWSFTKNFSFFGNLALATMWSRFHLKLKQTAIVEATNATFSLVDLKYCQYQMVPILELAIGMRWEASFCHDRRYAAVQWGWEEQMWWGYAHSFQFIRNTETSSNLNFQGLTIRGQVSF